MNILKGLCLTHQIQKLNTLMDLILSGGNYTIKVKETKIGPLSDGTNFEYSLQKEKR